MRPVRDRATLIEQVCYGELGYREEVDTKEEK